MTGKFEALFSEFSLVETMQKYSLCPQHLNHGSRLAKIYSQSCDISSNSKTNSQKYKDNFDDFMVHDLDSNACKKDFIMCW